MAHAFISYKHEDRDFALLVKSEIERAGFDTWIDSRLSAGECWARSIEAALNDAFALVVLLTPEAHESKYVIYEWSYALGRGIPVFPILRKSIDQSVMHQRLTDIQFLDFRHHYSWLDLDTALEKASGTYVRSQQTPFASPKYDRETPEQIGDAALTLLLKNLRSDRDDIRFGAIQVSRLTRQKEIIPYLVDIALNEEESGLICQAATLALGEIGGLSTMPVLHTILLGDKRMGVRYAAMYALSLLASEKSIPVLSEVVKRKNESQQLKIEALNALAQIDDPEANEAVMAALRDNYTDVVWAALCACEIKRSPDFIGELLHLLNDSRVYVGDLDGAIALKARDILAVIGTEEALHAVAEYDARHVDDEVNSFSEGYEDGRGAA